MGISMLQELPVHDIIVFSCCFRPTWWGYMYSCIVTNWNDVVDTERTNKTYGHRCRVRLFWTSQWNLWEHACLWNMNINNFMRKIKGCTGNICLWYTWHFFYLHVSAKGTSQFINNSGLNDDKTIHYSNWWKHDKCLNVLGLNKQNVKRKCRWLEGWIWAWSWPVGVYLMVFWTPATMLPLSLSIHIQHTPPWAARICSQSFRPEPDWRKEDIVIKTIIL